MARRADALQALAELEGPAFDGAPLLAAPHEGAEELCVLMEGDSFELLDITGQWAWGCLSLHGPVGYVHKDRLEAVA